MAAILGIAAFTLVLTATDPPGPGLDPDAMSYMGAGESVAHGAGYRIPAAGWSRPDSTAPLAHFPPGFPTALALPIRLGMAPPQAARLVEALSAAVTIGAMVLVTAAATTLLVGALLGAALMATPAIALVHISVLSEPLFLACTALTLAAMARRPRHPARDPLAIGGPAAVGVLTRYAGAALVGAAALWTLAIPGTRRERLRRAGLALLPAVLLQGAWMIRTRLLREPAEIRRVALYGQHLGTTAAHAGATLRDWLVPDPDKLTADAIPSRPLIAVAAALLLLLLATAGIRRMLAARRDEEPHDAPAIPPGRLLATSALLAACYLGILVVSRLVADPGILFDDRLLAPLFLIVSPAIAVLVCHWWRASTSMMARIAVSGVFLGWLAASGSATWGQVAWAREWGSDFAGEQWRRSGVLDWAGAHGATHPLYTNWPPLVYFYLHRPSRFVPGAAHAAELPAFADTVRAHDGRVLMFTVGDVDYVPADVARRAPGLHVVATFADGIVLAPSDAPPLAPRSKGKTASDR